MNNNVIKPVFQLAQTVYLVVNAETIGKVTGILYRQGSIQYLVTWCDHEEISHFDFELTDEKQVI